MRNLIATLLLLVAAGSSADGIVENGSRLIESNSVFGKWAYFAVVEIPEGLRCEIIFQWLDDAGYVVDEKSHWKQGPYSGRIQGTNLINRPASDEATDLWVEVECVEGR